MKKLFILLTLIVSSFAFAKHDSEIYFGGNNGECEDNFQAATQTLTQANLAYVINQTCENLSGSTLFEGKITLIDSKKKARAYEVKSTNNSCPQTMMTSLLALYTSGRIAFISSSCDYHPEDPTLQLGIITVISE